MMRTPLTEAGKRLLDWFGGPMREKNGLVELILAIEAEATTPAETGGYTLWDKSTANVVGYYATLDEAARAAFGMGQVNPSMDPNDIALAALSVEERP